MKSSIHIPRSDFRPPLDGPRMLRKVMIACAIAYVLLAVVFALDFIVNHGPTVRLAPALLCLGGAAWSWKKARSLARSKNGMNVA